MQPWRLGGKSITNQDRALYSKTPLAYNIDKIEVTPGTASSITVNSFKLIISDEANGAGETIDVAFKASATTTIDLPEGDYSNKYFKFLYNVTVSDSKKNKFVEFKSAKFYAALAEDAVKAPVIKGAEDFISETEIAIEAEDDVTVYYTVDGTEPTTASTVYTAPFTVKETTTVKAVAYRGEKASFVTSATFTKATQLTCAEAAVEAMKVASNNATTNITYVVYGYVTELDGGLSSGQQKFWVSDTKGGENTFYSYFCNVPRALVVGDYIQMFGKLTKYNTTPQMKNGDITILPAPVAKYNVTVTAENGTVEGAGEYEENAEATLTATAAEGYEFVNWTVGDSIVSTENPYKFTVTADLALVANFKVAVTTITETFDLIQEEDTRNMGGTYSIYAGDYTLRIFGYEGAGTYQDDTTTVEDAAPLLFTPDYDDALNPVVVVTIDEENNKEVMQVTATSADGKKIYNLTINIALPSYEKYSLIATGIKAENETVEGISVIKLKGEGYLNGEETVPFEFMVFESMMGYGAEGTIREINVFSTEAEFFAEEGEFLLKATMQDEEGKYLFNVEVRGTMPKAEVEIVVKETKDVTLYNLNLDVQGNMAMVTADNMTLSFNLTLLDTENYYGTYTNDAFSNIWYGDDQLYAAYGEAQVYAEVDGKAKFVVSFISTPDAEGNVTLYNFTLYAGDQPTGVDNINTTVAPVKVIENGQIFIISNGVKYNAQGAKL